MQIWQAIVLGIVQGLTEFLPVSSSGHLEITKAIFSIELGNCDILFDLILHFGTLLAVFVLYFKKILQLFQKPYRKLLYLIVATIPAGIVGVFLDDLLEEYCLNGLVCGICLIITAGLLLLCEYIAKRNKHRGKELPLTWKNTFAMGVAQAFAVLPGISRSGSTITAGVLFGGKSEEVADFSFLMSIPVILGSLVVKVAKLVFKDGLASTAVTAFGSATNMALCLILGVISAAVVGYLAIRLVLAAVKKANYKWFSLYLVFAAVVSFVLFGNGMFV